MIEPSSAEVVTQVASNVAKSDLSSYLMFGGGGALGALAFWRMALKFFHSSAIDRSGVQVRKDLDQSLVDTIQDLRHQVVEERRLAQRERDRADAAVITAQESMQRESELKGQVSVLTNQVKELREEVRDLIGNLGE